MTLTDTGNELSEILSETPAPAVVTGAETTATAPADTGQPRDETTGRFANKAADTEATDQLAIAPVGDQSAAVSAESGMVPQQALHAAREAAKTKDTENADLRRQLAELTGQVKLLSTQPRQQPPVQQQEQPKPKELWDDPAEYTDERVRTALTPIQQAMIFNARLTANAVNGEDKVNAAMTAFDELNTKGQLDQGEYRKVMSSPNPFHAAVEWHKRHSAIARVGTDPDAWLEAEFEKRLSDPTHQAKILERIQASAAQSTANRSSAPATQLPPSLHKLPGGTNSVSPGLADDSERFTRALAG